MGRDDDPIGAWAALLRAHATVVRVIAEEVEAQTGLPLSWYDVLLELDTAPGRTLRMQQLSERVVLSRTRVSRVVDEMERAGLVVRRPDATDGRVTIVTITADGRRARRRAAPIYLRAIARHFSDHLTPGQLVAVRSGLEAVLAAHAEPAPDTP